MSTKEELTKRGVFKNFDELRKIYKEKEARGDLPLAIELGISIDSYCKAALVAGSLTMSPEANDPIEYLGDNEKWLQETCDFTSDEIDMVKAYRITNRKFDPSFYPHSGIQGFIGIFQRELMAIKNSRS